MGTSRLKIPFLLLLGFFVLRAALYNGTTQLGWTASTDYVNHMILEMGGQELKQPVIVFGAPWCGSCRAAKVRLSKLGVSYFYADIEESEPARKYFMEVSEGSGAIPLVVVGEKAYIGYSDSTILENIEQDI